MFFRSSSWCFVYVRSSIFQYYRSLFRAGPVKLPAPVQMAHKLAELAGGMDDCGGSIDHKKYAGKLYFL